MNELYDSVDNNKLCFEYVGPAKGVNFYEYMDSKELFDKMRSVQLKYGVALKNKRKQKNWWTKRSD